MRILGIFDRLRKAEKTRFPTWMAVDQASPNDGDIIVAINNSGNAVCGVYKSHFIYIYRHGQIRKAITAYNRWSLVKRCDGTRLWRSFIVPPNQNDKIVAVSSDFAECLIATFNDGDLLSCRKRPPASMYEFWENYPDAAENKRI